MKARVRLGAIPPDEVAVELYLGRLDADGELAEPLAIPMRPVDGRDGSWVFEAATIPGKRSGRHGYTVRVMPFHPDEARAMIPGLIAWA